jgi:predicted RNase H-like HicB family nuclease
VFKKTIKIVIEKKKIYTDGTTGYIATSPQLKGILIVGEDTIEDTLLVFSEALNVYMKSVIKRHDKIEL